MVSLAMILKNIDDDAWGVTDDEDSCNDENHDTKALFNSFVSESCDLNNDKSTEDYDDGVGNDMNNKEVSPDYVDLDIKTILSENCRDNLGSFLHENI